MYATVILFLAFGAVLVIWISAESRLVKYASLLLLLAFLFVSVGMPALVRLTGPPSMGTGSYEHARLWRDKLATCNSLDDVRRHFNCGTFRANPGGSHTHITDPNTIREGNTWALLYDLPIGKRYR